MTTRRIQLAASIATALYLQGAPAFSAALGELVSLSAIGEPFRAEIRLANGPLTDAAGCLQVVVPADASHELPWLREGRVSIAGSGATARVIVTSARPIHEPALRLAIENSCEARLRREYTLLLPYPVTAPAAPAPTAAVPARPRETAPASSASGRTWSTAPGESLESLARSLYPDDAAARRRFTRATAAANPGLFPDGATHGRPLPPGTPIFVPDLRRLASQPAPARARAAAAESAPASVRTKRVPASPQEAARDRLVVAGEALPASPRRSTPDADWPARERELAAAIDRSIIAEMELQARIKELEEAQARLEAHIRARLAPPAAPPPQAATVAAPPPPAPATPPATTPSTADPGRQDRYVMAGLALATLALVALLLRRRRAPRREPPPAGARVPSAPPATATPAVTAQPPKQAPVAELDHIEWHSPGHLGAGDEPLEEHKSAVELAEIMMSFGRLHGAAETLAEFIRGNPDQAVAPWLKLLEVYRAAGLRVEFDAVAREFNKTFNINTVNWNNYDSLRTSAQSLEQMPHIVDKLQRTWRTQECQDYLQHLLRDNRSGTRAGFPFTVIDEILVLSAILEDEFGPPSPRNPRRAANGKAAARAS